MRFRILHSFIQNGGKSYIKSIFEFKLNIHTWIQLHNMNSHLTNVDWDILFFILFTLQIQLPPVTSV